MDALDGLDFSKLSGELMLDYRDVRQEIIGMFDKMWPFWTGVIDEKVRGAMQFDLTLHGEVAKTIERVMGEMGQQSERMRGLEERLAAAEARQAAAEQEIQEMKAKQAAAEAKQALLQAEHRSLIDQMLDH